MTPPSRGLLNFVSFDLSVRRGNSVCVCPPGKSDPYVKIKLGLGQEMKTEYKKRTLNPRFDEEFDLLVYEQSVEVGGAGRSIPLVCDVSSTCTTSYVIRSFVPRHRCMPCAESLHVVLDHCIGYDFVQGSRQLPRLLV